MFQEKWYQISKQEEEELQQLRETYHYKQHNIMIYSSANELKMSRETADQLFKRQEVILKQMIEVLHEESKMFSSELIQTEVLTLTSEYPSSADQFERKFQSKISPTGKILEKQEEELIEFK